MTFYVNNKALKKAMLRMYEEKLSKDMREMFVYSSNPEMTKIWQMYLEELQREEQTKRQNRNVIFEGIFLGSVALTIMLVMYLFPVR